MVRTLHGVPPPQIDDARSNIDRFVNKNSMLHWVVAMVMNDVYLRVTACHTCVRLHFHMCFSVGWIFA